MCKSYARVLVRRYRPVKCTDRGRLGLRSMLSERYSVPQTKGIEAEK